MKCPSPAPPPPFSARHSHSTLPSLQRLTCDSPVPDPQSRPSSRSWSLLWRHPLHICRRRRDFDRQLQKEQPSERSHVRHCSAISALLLLAPLWLKPVPSGCRWTWVTSCIFSGLICGRASNSCEWTACSMNRERFRCLALRVFFPNSPAPIQKTVIALLICCFPPLAAPHARCLARSPVALIWYRW